MENADLSLCYRYLLLTSCKQSIAFKEKSTPVTSIIVLVKTFLQKVLKCRKISKRVDSWRQLLIAFPLHIFYYMKLGVWTYLFMPAACVTGDGPASLLLQVLIFLMQRGVGHV